MPTLDEIDIRYDPSDKICKELPHFYSAAYGEQDPKHSPIGPDKDSHLTNEQLAELLTTSHSSSPFARVQDLSLLEQRGNTTPVGRHESEFYEYNETAWIAATNNHISNGDITKNALVVAITGHGPTIGWAMAKQYGSDAFFYLPKEFADKSTRNEGQAQTFFQGIHDGQKQGRQGTSTLLSFDVHQNQPDGPDLVRKLPTANEIRDQGIDKVVLAIESKPGQEWKSYRCIPDNHAVVLNWLKGIQRDGIPVLAEGFDLR